MSSLTAEQNSALDKMLAYAVKNKRSRRRFAEAEDYSSEEVDRLNHKASLVQGLVDRGATSGERQAAQAALDRIQASIDEVEANSAVAPFVFSGLAGTGKTTVTGHLIHQLVADHGFSPQRIAVVAYTGKATSVLNKKLGHDCPVVATTIHKFLYSIPIDGLEMLEKKLQLAEKEIELAAADGDSPRLSLWQQQHSELTEEFEILSQRGNNLRFTRRDITDIRACTDLVVVDEASMVDDEIAAHMEETGLPVIYIGDGNQLPPVGKPFGVNLSRPDASLTTIMRQQGDSAIIPFAHDILKQRKLPGVLGTYGDGVARSRSSNATLYAKKGDVPQFVVFFNKTRHEINRTIRTAVLGFPKCAADPLAYTPRYGEKIILDANLPTKRLMKGDTLEVVSASFDGSKSKSKFSLGKAGVFTPIVGSFEVKDAYGTIHEMDLFLNDLMISMNSPAALFDEREVKAARMGSIPVMFPYAITAYKAQGSEWDNVVVFNEKTRPEIYLPYIYTAVTRAKSSLVVVG